MLIQVLNGPNLNMLGIREPGIYGNKTLPDINNLIKLKAEEYNIEIDFYQSNHEGHIIDKIHESYGKIDGLIINPGAFTHYRYAIRDAISSVGLPTVEVHLSDINMREDFRKISVIKDVCVNQISGKGINSYMEALEYLVSLINDRLTV